MAERNKQLFCQLVGEDRTEWVIEDGDIPELPKDGVIVKVQHAGVCHSDVHMSQPGYFPGFQYPRVFGHETSGVVHTIGPDCLTEDQDLKTGDRVAIYPWGNCNKCPLCKNDFSYCRTNVDPQFDKSKSYIYGVRKDGGFQNYVVVHDASFLIKVPSGVSMAAASLVPCSGITAYNACTAIKEAVATSIELHGTATVGIMGAGGLALWAIQIIKAMFPVKAQVVVVDIMDEKLQDAEAQGADKIFKWGVKDELSEVVGAYMKEVGCRLDAAIDFTGHQNVLLRTFALLNMGATMAMVGLGSKTLPNLDLFGLVLRNVTIKGINTGTKKMARELFGLIETNKVKAPPIMDVTLEDVGETISLMRQNKVRGRRVVKM